MTPRYLVRWSELRKRWNVIDNERCGVVVRAYKSLAWANKMARKLNEAK
jgi:hypothetical protein